MRARIKSFKMMSPLPLSFTLFLIINTLFPFDSFSQNDQRSLIKAGGYLNFNHSSGFSGFIFSLEKERTFKKNMSFTHGPRLDYDKAKRDLSKNFPGIENLIVGYGLKFYPFYFKSHKPYKGIFIGLYPCYFMPINIRYKYGPGVGSPIGYQHVFKDKISLGFEGSVIYMRNINENAFYQSNPKNKYYYFLLCFKVGLKLNHKTRPK